MIDKWYNAMTNVKLGIEKEDVVEAAPYIAEEFYQYSGATNELFVQVKASNVEEAYEKLLEAFATFDDKKTIPWMKEYK